MKQCIGFILAAVLSIGLLTGCGGNEAAPVQTPDAPGSSAAASTTSEAPAAATIVGTWKYRGSLDCEYTFCADGTGIYNYTGTKMPFTYTDDGTAVSILYEGNTDPTVLKYTISEETLNIEDSFGQVMQYDLVTQ